MLKTGDNMKKQTKSKFTAKKSIINSLPKNRVEYLELLIRMTEKRIDSNSFDMTMENQANRLKAELSKLKAK